MYNFLKSNTDRVKTLTLNYFYFSCVPRKLFFLGKFLQFPLVITRERTNRHCRSLLQHTICALEIVITFVKFLQSCTPPVIGSKMSSFWSDPFFDLSSVPRKLFSLESFFNFLSLSPRDEQIVSVVYFYCI